MPLSEDTSTSADAPYSLAERIRDRYPSIFGVPSLPARIIVSIEAAVFVAWIIHLGAAPFESSQLAFDFSWPWRAARILLEGHNPYVAIQATGSYPFNAPFKYPLPAALVALPFAPLSATLAHAAFVGVGVGLFTFAVSRTSFARLILLASGCAFVAVVNAQSSFLLIAGALLPPLGFVLAIKPTIGLALFCWNPRWKTALGCLAIVLVSTLILPTWPSQWLHAMRADPARLAYVAPVMRLYAGPVLVLAASRWRLPEGRLLLAMACIPHAMLFYDELVVLLVGRSVRELALLSLLSIAACVASYSTAASLTETAKLEHHAQFVLWCIYLPALVMVLRRSNVGAVPGWVESAASRLPRWLRGAPGQ